MRARWWALLGVAVVVVVGVLVGLSVSGSGGSGTPSSLTGAADVNAQFAGLPQAGPRLGRADAPVRITEYADLQCPYCAQLATETIPHVIDTWVRPGTANLTFKTFELIGPASIVGAQGAQAAALQNRVWPFVELVYRNQGSENGGWLTTAFVRKAAAQIDGIDAATFATDLSSTAVRAAVNTDQASGDQVVTGTPHLTIQGPGGTRVLEGFQTPAAIDATIQSVR